MVPGRRPHFKGLAGCLDEWLGGIVAGAPDHARGGRSDIYILNQSVKKTGGKGRRFGRHRTATSGMAPAWRPWGDYWVSRPDPDTPNR
jgi:hypothetical protein